MNLTAADVLLTAFQCCYNAYSRGGRQASFNIFYSRGSHPRNSVPVYSPGFLWVLIAPTRGRMAPAELTWVHGSAPRWFTHPKTLYSAYSRGSGQAGFNIFIAGVPTLGFMYVFTLSAFSEYSLHLPA